MVIKRIIGLIIKIPIALFMLLMALASLITYFEGIPSIDGEIVRDNSQLTGAIIAILFGFVFVPYVTNLILNIGRSRQVSHFLLSKVAGSNYDPNDYTNGGQSDKDFFESGTWGQSGALVTKAYLKPMSLILGIAFIYIYVVLDVIELFNSGTTLSYIISELLLKLFFTLPIVLLYVYLNFRFYPWVKLWAINLNILNKVFPTSEGFTKAFSSGIRSVNEAYDKTPMNHIIRYTRIHRYGRNEERVKDYEKEHLQIDDDKKHERDKMIVKQGLIYTWLRYGISVFLWGFSFILGWIVLPRVVKLILERENIKVIKNFYPKSDDSKV